MESFSRRRAAIATFSGAVACTAIAALQSIVLLPSYLHWIGPQQYGMWLATGELLLWLVAFDCGIPNQMIQRIGQAHAKGFRPQVAQQFASGMALLLSLSILVFVVASGLTIFLAPEFLRMSLVLASAATSLVIINYGFQGLGRAIQQTAAINGIAIAATVAGFVTTFFMLQGGQGLISIATGLLVRSGGGTVGSIVVFCFHSQFDVARRGLKVLPDDLKELLRESPTMLVSGVAYALMNHSQIMIATVTLGPVAAVSLSVTRKVVEFAKAVLDTISYASEGGFAHLIAEGNVDSLRKAIIDVDHRFWACASLLLGGYIALNPSFVPLWTRGQYHGDLALTMILAFGMGASAWSYLGIARLRASGEFRTASRFLIADCFARVALMALGTVLAGLYGLAIGAALPPILLGIIVRRRLSIPIPRTDQVAILSAAIPAAGAILTSLTVRAEDWATFIGIWIAFSISTLALLAVMSRKSNVELGKSFLRRAA